MPGVKKTDLTIYAANPYNRYDRREAGLNAAIVSVRKSGTLAVMHTSWRAAPREGHGGLQAKYIDVQFGRQEILRCPRDSTGSRRSGIRFEFSIPRKPTL